MPWGHQAVELLCLRVPPPTSPVAARFRRIPSQSRAIPTHMVRTLPAPPSLLSGPLETAKCPLSCSLVPPSHSNDLRLPILIQNRSKTRFFTDLAPKSTPKASRSVPGASWKRPRGRFGRISTRLGSLLASRAASQWHKERPKRPERRSKAQK